MKTQDNPVLREILLQAIEIAPEERGPFIAHACAGNPELKVEIESLLGSLQKDEELLREPTMQRDVLQSNTSKSETRRPHGERSGERIGRYKLLQLIGEGGFGSVFMAEQESPVVRKVALKIIKLGMDTKQVIARFEAERQALAMMDHPNIARVLDAGATESGRPYFVMELVRGVPITKFCDDNKLTTRQRLELFMPVCSALQHAHQKGIIHRDLKPGNVLVTMHDDKPVPKIIDFGVAKAINQRLTEHTLFTEFHQLIGTPAYMSPEQAQMSGLDVDTRSDIYSLGVLLYELLTGATPFDSKELHGAAYDEMRRIIREVEPPKPSTRLSTLAIETQSAVADHRRCDPKTLARALEGELDWIILRCLEKDRGRRYETAGGLARDIQRYLNDELVEASPPSLSYRARKFARKHQLVMSVGLLLLMATLFSTWQAIRATRAANVARAEQRRADQQTGYALAQAAEVERQRKQVEAQKTKADEEKLEAQKQQRIAASFNQFLFRTLSSDDPAKFPVDKVTLAQAITLAEKQLDSDQKQLDPMTEAGLRNTIGRIFQAMARYDDAEMNLRKSLEIFRKISTPGSLDLANGVADLASVLAEESKLQEAEKLQREALELYRKVLPAEPLYVADCLVGLGQVLGRVGKFSEAEKNYREALAIKRKSLPPGSLALSSSLSNLGLHLSDSNQLDESERLLREALEIDRRSLPAGHPRIASDLDNLAFMLSHRREGHKDAVEMYREALTINQAAYPSGHPSLSRNLGDLAKQLGEDSPDEAEKLFREALDMDRRLLPADHPDIARDLNCLAMFLEYHGKESEAEKLFREVIEIDRKSLPRDHPDVRTHLDNLTTLLLRQKRIDDAEKLQREAMEFDRQTLPAGHPQIATDLTHVAVLLGRLNKPHDAELLYREALEIERSAPPDVHTDIGVTLNDLAYLLLGQDRLAESEKLFGELVAIERNNHAPATSLGLHLHVLANVLQRQNKLREAEPLMREAMAIRRESYPSNSTGTAANATDLGLLLQKMTRLPEAEALLREALKIYTSAPKPDNLVIANVSSGLGRTLLSENKYAEAEPLLRDALATRDHQLGTTDVATIRTATALADLLDRTARRGEADQLRQSHGIQCASTRPVTGAISEGK